MLNLYEKNGLVFWTEDEIKIRRMMVSFFTDHLRTALLEVNRAFQFIEVEAPLLTPTALINKQYTSDDVFTTEDLVLRPETTMGSYQFAQHLLTTHSKIRLPFVIWQHGKSFRREQDQVVKNMRLKEFYQLEFQICYSPTTMNDYSLAVLSAVQQMIAKMIGKCRIEPSDRLPDYAEWTKDVVLDQNDMELVSISQRKDFALAKVLEVAIGTDRCVHNFCQA